MEECGHQARFVSFLSALIEKQKESVPPTFRCAPFDIEYNIKDIMVCFATNYSCALFAVDTGF
jgi:hypothetical protein